MNTRVDVAQLEMAREFDLTVSELMRINGHGGYDELGSSARYRWGAEPLAQHSPLSEHASFGYWLELPWVIYADDLVTRRFQRSTEDALVYCTTRVAYEDLASEYIVDESKTAVSQYTVEEHEMIRGLVSRVGPKIRDWVEPDWHLLGPNKYRSL